MCKWSLIKPTINISYENDYAFRFACVEGHLGVAQWLLSIKPDINISANNEHAFKYTCFKGHLEVAQWLLSIKPDIDISVDNDVVFRFVCQTGDLVIAQWLQSLKPNKYVLEIENNKIIKYHPDQYVDDRPIMFNIHL